MNELVCFNTHSLLCRKRKSLAMLRGIAAEDFHEFILRCAKCQGRITSDQPSLACERAVCNKDFCLTCCQTMAMQTQVCCGLDHAMKKRHFNDPKVRRMQSGALQVYGGTLDCNVCHGEISESHDLFFTCEEMCDYDICFNCMSCPEGRQLYRAFRPYDDAAAANGAKCLRCNQTKQMEQLFQCVCPLEDHMVCGTCLVQR